jgi:endonuclease YncB( thermonuclease family)
MLILYALALATGQPFTCDVVKVHDGDGPFHCRNGVSVRLKGVQAPDFENTEPCRRHKAGYVCSDRLARQSRDRMAALILGKRLTCTATGKSWKRTVATCSLWRQDLSCLAITHGVGTRWARYDPQRKLVQCKASTGLVRKQALAPRLKR